MKLALCQVNPTVGDFEGNLRRLLDGCRWARDAGARLAVFPEMCLTGYPPRDLLERAAFLEGAARAWERALAEVRGVACLLGTVETHAGAAGRPLRNVAKLLDGGRVLATHAKCLLPFYDVFDEQRYFEPGTHCRPAQLDGRALALTVCEDIWHDALCGPRRALYERDPAAELVAGGAQVIINIAASPWHLGKGRLREELLQRLAQRHRRPIVMVNQVGGNDELVFDGASLALSARGEVLARAACFEEDRVLVDLEAGAGALRAPPAADEEALWRALVLGTRDYVAKCGFRTALVGLSGGIDSSLVAAIAAEALGPGQVLGVSMPSRFTSVASREDAAELARRLGVGLREIPIEGVQGAFLEALAASFAGHPADVTEENLQARVRGTILMALSNKLGSLVLSTGNKSEVAVGYCTLYGDMCGGLAVISDVPKTTVYALARWRNREDACIPLRAIERPPTAELRADQRDTDSLPPYDELDPVLQAYVERALAPEAIDAPRALEVARMVDRSEYKRRQAPPGLKVTTKAFGMGRRYPIARR